MTAKTKCPHPEKVAHKTRYKARQAMWALFQHSRQSDRMWTHVYHCTCGRWHVGHFRVSRAS